MHISTLLYLNNQTNLDMPLTIERVLTEEQNRWLTDEFWPVPSWLKKDSSTIELRNYKSFLEYNLRARYLVLEGEFRTIFHNYYESPQMDLCTAGRIVGLLQPARTALESREVNLYIIASNANQGLKIQGIKAAAIFPNTWSKSPLVERTLLAL